MWFWPNRGSYFGDRVSPAEITIAILHEPGMPSKRTKEVRLGIYRAQIRPNEHDIVVISGQGLNVSGYQESRHSFWLANWKFGYNNVEFDEKIYSQPPQLGIVAEDILR